ncbi:MAG: nickel-dependent lactate racemase [Ignavibacteriae bacterium]|nr:nickel-dependent lactate racemase [Ignavibacteriota bacterium]
MKVHLAYGKEGLDVNLPERNLVKVMTMPAAKALSDPDDEIARALQDPIASPPLSDLVRRAKSVCVVICDVTRPAPNKIMLPHIFRVLEENGVSRKNITVLVATGLHRSSKPEELEEMVGADILNSYRIVDHHARNTEEQKYLGQTSNNTPVYIDKEYCNADLKITTGFIEPHLMAGFSGGRKLIAPGCAGELTIKSLHSPFFLENPLCKEGSIEFNPLHHELLEIARMAGHDFIVNVAMNESGKLTGVFAGDPIRAHEAGIAHVRHSVRSTVLKPVDIVITTSAGYPLDLTFYQAVKGMTAALPIVKKGGMLIMAAECAEGLGSDEFCAMAMRFDSAETFLQTILSNPVVLDQWQLEECAKAVKKADVVLVSSGIPAEHRDRLFVRSSDSVESALRQGLAKYGDDATVAVIPKGPYTLVDVEGEAA